LIKKQVPGIFVTLSRQEENRGTHHHYTFISKGRKMLYKLLSEQRLKPYGLGKVPDALVIGRYKWNLALSEALYPTLSLFEIGLRNRVDEVLTNLYTPQWLDTNSSLLQLPEKETIATAQEGLKRKKEQLHRSKLIAELNFGFWTKMFSSSYHPLIWHRKDKPLKTVFSTASGLSAKQVHDQLMQIKSFRNRIAHHEAIWNKPGLYKTYQTTFIFLEGLGSPLLEIAKDLDRFPKVWMKNPDKEEF
jgi:Abi-like protein